MFTECLFLAKNSDDYNFLLAILSFTVLSTVFALKKIETFANHEGFAAVSNCQSHMISVNKALLCHDSLETFTHFNGLPSQGAHAWTSAYVTLLMTHLHNK